MIRVYTCTPRNHVACKYFGIYKLIGMGCTPCTPLFIVDIEKYKKGVLAFMVNSNVSEKYIKRSGSIACMACKLITARINKPFRLHAPLFSSVQVLIEKNKLKTAYISHLLNLHAIFVSSVQLPQYLLQTMQVLT